MAGEREREEEWGRWLLARASLSFALEDELRAASDVDSPYLDPDGTLARAASERLTDAIERLIREIAARLPPPGLAPLRDTCVAYLRWRLLVAARMTAALGADGWDGALAVLAAAEAEGRAFYAAFIDQVRALEARRDG